MKNRLLSEEASQIQSRTPTVRTRDGCFPSLHFCSLDVIHCWNFLHRRKICIYNSCLPLRVTLWPIVQCIHCAGRKCFQMFDCWGHCVWVLQMHWRYESCVLEGWGRVSPHGVVQTKVSTHKEQKYFCMTAAYNVIPFNKQLLWVSSICTTSKTSCG